MPILWLTTMHCQSPYFAISLQSYFENKMPYPFENKNIRKWTNSKLWGIIFNDLSFHDYFAELYSSKETDSTKRFHLILLIKENTSQAFLCGSISWMVFCFIYKLKDFRFNLLIQKAKSQKNLLSQTNILLGFLDFISVFIVRD